MTRPLPLGGRHGIGARREFDHHVETMDEPHAGRESLSIGDPVLRSSHPFLARLADRLLEREHLRVKLFDEILGQPAPNEHALMRARRLDERIRSERELPVGLRTREVKGRCQRWHVVVHYAGAAAHVAQCL